MAVTFTGPSYLSTTNVPSGLQQNSAPFTCAMWAYVTNVSPGTSILSQTSNNQSGFINVVGSAMGGTGGTRFMDALGIQMWSVNGDMYASQSVNFYTELWQIDGGVIPLNTWTHLAITFTTAQLTGYINAAVVSAGPDSSGVSPTATSVAWNRIVIGGFSGHGQDAVMYNRALSANEIAALASRRLPIDRTGLVGYWPLFADSPTLDWSGNGRTLSATGSVTAASLTPPVTWAGEGAKIFVHIPSASAPVSTTYIRQSAGQLIEVRTVSTSAGAADADKVPSLNASGYLDASIVNATVTSAGAGDSGKLVALNGSGLVDATCLPAGSSDTKTLTASEALAAGDLVNIDTATGQVRKANASNGRAAHGFVLAAVSAAASATVYLSGRLTGLTGLTTGATYFLSGTTAGAVTATAPTTTGQLWQPVGTAVSATEIAFAQEPAVTL